MSVSDECRVRIVSSGTEYLKTVGYHDWRLIDERPDRLERGNDSVSLLVGVRRRWYCTRCRLVETTEEEHPARLPGGERALKAGT